MYAYTYRVLNLELNFSISGEANFGFLFKTCQTVLLTLNFYIAHTHTFPNFNLKMGGGGKVEEKIQKQEPFYFKVTEPQN